MARAQSPEPTAPRYRALFVAATEDAAEDLLLQCQAHPRLLPLGLAAPDTAAALAQALGAELVIAPVGTRLPAAVRLPVTYVSPDTALADLQWQWGEAADAPAATAPPPAPPVAQRIPAPALRLPCQVRLGFYGIRGGLGVTTAAVTAARELAARPARVAVCDVPRRGDVALLLGGTPGAEPQLLEHIVVQPGLLTESEAAQFEVVILDGGRRRAPFAAAWHELHAPLTAAWLARVLRDWR